MNWNFISDRKIGFDFTHEFPSINKNKNIWIFNLYVTNNDAVSIAKLFIRMIFVRKGEFKTYKKSARKNKEIEKLYGSGGIFIFGIKMVY